MLGLRMGSKDLRHKVLCVAEDRGVERASYALKLLQSDGALTIASTGKDPGSGRLVSQEYLCSSSRRPASRSSSRD